jgi:hypothetical protein
MAKRRFTRYPSSQPDHAPHAARGISGCAPLAPVL